MRKFVAGAVTLLALSLALTSALAVTENEAETLALETVGSTARLQRTERDDDGLYEVNLTDDQARYQVDVRQSDGAIIEVDMDVIGAARANTFELSEAQASDAVLALHPGANIDFVVQERDDGSCEYEVFYSLEGEIGSVTINASTGDVVGTKLWPEAAALNVIKADAAVESAKSRKAGDLADLELSYERRGYVYDGEILDGRTEYSFEIDALTGSVIEWERDD